MHLELDLVTSFHRELVTVAWLQKLTEFLSVYDRLKGRGLVRSDYNQERFMGPQSVVKYRFKVEFADPAPDDSPLWSGQTAEVEYRPREGTFKLRNLWWSVHWMDEIDLERAGIPPLDMLPELVVLRCLEPALARSWSMVPVGHEEGHVVVAFADPAQIERAADVGWQFQRPVRLRHVSPDELSALLDAVYGELEAVDFLGLEPGEPLEGEPCERHLFRERLPMPGLGERYLRVDGPSVVVSVEQARGRIAAFFQRQDWPACRVREVSPGEWEHLCRLADEDLVWVTMPTGQGERWKLESSSATTHRRVRRWSEGLLRDEPFVRCCLGLLLAGFEVGVERETHWM